MIDTIEAAKRTIAAWSNCSCGEDHSDELLVARALLEAKTHANGCEDHCCDAACKMAQQLCEADAEVERLKTEWYRMQDEICVLDAKHYLVSDQRDALAKALHQLQSKVVHVEPVRECLACIIDATLAEFYKGKS
jgi:hypothetical protein